MANIGVSTDLMAVINVEDAGCPGDDGKISFNVGGGVQPFEVDLIYADGFVDSRSGSGFFQFMGLIVINPQSGVVFTRSASPLHASFKFVIIPQGKSIIYIDPVRA